MPAPNKTRNHRCHPNEFDLDLNSPCPDLKPLLKQLKPLLQEIVIASKKCKHHHPVRGGGYHNITVCEH